jgi:hypothetical protein
MQFSELVERAHKTAVEKGWHEGKKRTLDRAAALALLIVSEVTEAVDEWNGFSAVVVDWAAEKPDHFIFELADIVIRLADMYGFFGWEYDDFDIRAAYACEPELALAEAVDVYKAIDSLLTRPLRAEGFPLSYTPRNIVDVVASWWASHGPPCTRPNQYGVELVRAITHKMAYNDTRSYRHGGKLL